MDLNKIFLNAVVIVVCVTTILALPSCQNNYWPDPRHDPAFEGYGRAFVQEGFVTLHDGEETKVSYKKPFQAPPRLSIAEINQSWFKEQPYKKDNFQFGQQEATFFKIQNNHAEKASGAWAVVKWRADGIRAPERPLASKSRREQIIAVVEKAGGKITTNPPLSDGPLVGIDLHRTRITDADLSLLQGLNSLRSLNLYGTQISDAGLIPLAGLTSLQALYLNDTAITDAGLQHLQRLTGLRALGLYHTRISDQGLHYLGGLANLQDLNLDSPHITDQGLKQLRSLSNLKKLSLYHTSVTDAGIQELRQACPRMQIIR